MLKLELLLFCFVWRFDFVLLLKQIHNNWIGTKQSIWKLQLFLETEMVHLGFITLVLRKERTFLKRILYSGKNIGRVADE